MQWHSSRAIPSQEAWGFELTATLEELVGSLDEQTNQELGRVSSTGTVTILFTDIQDSTSLSSEMGDAQWADILETHFATITQTVEGCGGTVIKTLGDGAMAAFPGAEAAVTAATQIQQRNATTSLKVRIGVHTGDAQRVAGDYVGVTVSKAARVTSAASGGEILLSSITAELTAGSNYDFGADRNVELKGIPGIHKLTPIKWSTAT